MSISTHLLAEIDGFLSRTGMAESSFGRQAVNDWKFVRDLREEGRRVWPETAERVREFMASFPNDEAAQAREKAA